MVKVNVSLTVSTVVASSNVAMSKPSLFLTDLNRTWLVTASISNVELPSSGDYEKFQNIVVSNNSHVSSIKQERVAREEQSRGG